MRQIQAPSGEELIGGQSIFIIYIAPTSFYVDIFLSNTITNIITVMEWCPAASPEVNLLKAPASLNGKNKQALQRRYPGKNRDFKLMVNAANFIIISCKC